MPMKLDNYWIYSVLNTYPYGDLSIPLNNPRGMKVFHNTIYCKFLSTIYIRT